MKTKQQVIEFLDKMGVLGKVLVNTMREGRSLQHFEESITTYKAGLILGLFCWIKTNEGPEFWSRFDKIYRAWFNHDTNKEPKIIIIKL